MPEQLQSIEVPEPILYLWGWFCDISNARQYGMSGPLPISYSEIKAWSELAGIDPDPWEVSALKRLDQVYLIEASKKS